MFEEDCDLKRNMYTWLYSLKYMYVYVLVFETLTKIPMTTSKIHILNRNIEHFWFYFAQKYLTL